MPPLCRFLPQSFTREGPSGCASQAFHKHSPLSFLTGHPLSSKASWLPNEPIRGSRKCGCYWRTHSSLGEPSSLDPGSGRKSRAPSHLFPASSVSLLQPWILMLSTSVLLRLYHQCPLPSPYIQIKTIEFQAYNISIPHSPTVSASPHQYFSSH